MNTQKTQGKGLVNTYTEQSSTT